MILDGFKVQQSCGNLYSVVTLIYNLWRLTMFSMNHRRRSSSAARRNRRAPCLEQLETRALLSTLGQIGGAAGSAYTAGTQAMEYAFMKRNMGARHTTLLALAAIMLVLTGWNQRAIAQKPAPAPTLPPMPIDYLVTWLDAPTGGSNSQATSSNSAGTVAGYYADVNGKSRACIWTAVGVFDLNAMAPVPSDWVLVTARAINEFGQIAGSARYNPTGQIRQYRYDPPTATTSSQIALMGDLTSSVSYSIAYMRPLNNLGDVAYSATLADGKHYAYVQTMDNTLLQRQGNGFNSINDGRQLVGGNIRWNAASGLVETFSSSITATDINASGTFVGRMYPNGKSAYKAMRYKTSAQVIGPASSFAFGINSLNDVVGYVGDTGVGFIFTDTYGYVDLDTLVIAANANDLATWASATSIQPLKITDQALNGFGKICGTAFLSGNVNLAFVLTPIPAP